MKSLAAYMEQTGWKLSGTDPRADFDRPAGSKRWLSADEQAPLDSDVDLVVYTAAVGPEHPQRQAAAQLGIPCRSYPQMLAELMTGRRGLAVAGTHGKSTTAALLAHCLWAAGGDPSVVFGAQWLDGAPGGHSGRDETLVVEACEYNGNFLDLGPQAAVVLNVEWDHVDCFAGTNDVFATFQRFVRQLPPRGFLVVHVDCPQAPALIRAARCPTITLGTTPAAEYRYVPVDDDDRRNGLRIFHQGCLVGQARLAVPGVHQAACAAAAAVMALEWGAAWSDVRRGLERFTGLRRRMEMLGTIGDVDVWDDYAHHPTAVAAALATLRKRCGKRRLVCLFEPHQEARLAAMLDEFAASLHNADLVGVAPVFRARESGRPSSPDLCRRLASELNRRGTPATLLPTDATAGEKFHELLAPGDVMIALGAGDVRRLVDGIVERLGRDRAAE